MALIFFWNVKKNPGGTSQNIGIGYCFGPLKVLVMVLGIVKASSKIGIGVKKSGIAQVCPTGTYMTASAIVNSLSRTDSMAEADVELLQSDRFYGLSRGRIPSVGQFL